MKLRIGIVGCGSISEFRHFPEYLQRSDVEVVSCYDSNRTRSEKMAQLFGVKVAPSMEELVQNPAIDAISDCSPNHQHSVVTTMALQHGKHVLCEKPMALTAELCRAMNATADKAGKLLMIAHNQRLAPAHVKAKAIIQSGELGRVLSFRTTFGHKGPEYWSEEKSNKTWFFSQSSSGFGVAGDIAIHKIDLLRYLLGDEFVDVQATVFVADKKNPDGSPIAVPDNLVSIVRMKGGSYGTLTASWTYYGPEDNSTVLYCEKGIMTIYQDPEFQLRVSKFGGEDVYFKIGEIQTNDKQSNSGIVDAFVEAIHRGGPAPISGVDGLRGIEVVEAIFESSKTGRRVAVGHS